MKTIKIDSWKRANTSALVQVVVSVLVCILYHFIIFILTGGEEFVGKQPTKEVINGIRYDVVLIVSGVLAGIVPIVFLKYKNIKFLFLYIPLSILYYLVIMFLFMCIIEDYNVFDLINYAITSIPVGSLIGTVIAIFINYFNKKKNSF